MASPEMGPREPEEKNKQESEQTLEQILALINEAIETKKGLLISQKLEDGRVITNSCFPLAINGDNLDVDAGDWGLSIFIESIKKVEIFEPEEEDG